MTLLRHVTTVHCSGCMDVVPIDQVEGNFCRTCRLESEITDLREHEKAVMVDLDKAESRARRLEDEVTDLRQQVKDLEAELRLVSTPEIQAYLREPTGQTSQEIAETLREGDVLLFPNGTCVTVAPLVGYDMGREVPVPGRRVWSRHTDNGSVQIELYRVAEDVAKAVWS